MESLYQHLNLDPSAPYVYETINGLAENRDLGLLDWIDHAAKNLLWAVHLMETIFDPQTIILVGGAPETMAKLLIAAMEPLLSSNSERPDRILLRLQLGMTDPWTVAPDAATEPISRVFAPRFFEIFK